MCDYGFTENKDYVAISQKRETAQKNTTVYTDHQITLDMAKQICMIQRTDVGKQYREYFLEIERKWNSPEAVMARALKFANSQIEEITAKNKELETTVTTQKKEIKQLETTNEVLVEDILSWADRSLINAIIRRYGAQCGGFGMAWTTWKKEFLYKYGININARITAYRNSTGKVTKPKTLNMINDDELSNALRTAVSMCEDNGIDVSDLLIKHKDSN